MSGWQLSTGPAKITVDIAPELDLVWTPETGAGLYELQELPATASGAATVTVLCADRGTSSRLDLDLDTDRVTVYAAPGDLSAQDLAFLSYLVLESRLHRHGIVTLHGAAVVRDGRAVVLLGHPGAGKTTIALRLCRDHGFALLGNDLVVVGDAPPQVFAGTQFLRLRQSSVIAALPELSHLFRGVSDDPWRSKIDVPAAQAGIGLGVAPAVVSAVVFLHADPSYSALIDTTGESLVHRLNLYENSLRYIRGASTPWLIGSQRNFGPYVPSLDSPSAHVGRTATLQTLLAMSRYVAGPPSQVAAHVSRLCRAPATAATGGSL